MSPPRDPYRAVCHCRCRSLPKLCSMPNCNAKSSKLCDYPVTRNGVQGTCDRPLCSRCAVSQGKDVDYCPEHARVASEVSR